MIASVRIAKNFRRLYRTLSTTAGLGVNLDVYTVAALDKRQHAVEVLEASLIH